MNWDKATDIILYASFAIVGVFAIMGLCQLVKRKSLKKVDQKLLMMPIPLIIMAIVYVIFDKFLVLNTRPDGSGEASFPSTHVMVVGTIFLLTTIALPKYIKSKATCAILDIIMLALFAITAYGRIAANMHWLSDVVAGAIFAAIFGAIYYLITRESKHA
ncbi:phosphatase PAP2 family protein [Candidatus Saccharibacteria bacterium]|nr:phosphatase PAP2 family protein [Candidatus Saccharibacteria bacterium]